jgi:acyl-CoA synthetase (AMP-forming)/AMP-acid ligase II
MLLDMAAEAFPDRVAVTSEGRSLTYRELRVAAQGAAERLRACGCRYAALLDTHGLAAPVLLFGAAYAGVPYVPLSYRLTGGELEGLLERVRPALLVAESVYLAALQVPAGIEVVAGRELLTAGIAGRSMSKEPDPDSVAIQLFTSGTTGKPKAAVLRHQNALSYVLGTVEFGSAEEAEATLIAVPPYHVAGIAAVLSSTYAGRRMVLLPSFEAAQWLRLCRTERITHAFLVPTMLARIVDHLESPDGASQLHALRAIAYGGGRMPQSVIERAMRLLPAVDFTNAYGLTETSSTICLLAPADHRAAFASGDPAVRRRLGSVGKPLAGIELQIRDASGRVLGPDGPGMIFVRGGQVAGEYRDSGSALDRDGWFCTHDRGWVDRDGYVYLDGRADDVIVRGGENISPGEIEAVLLGHPAVSDAAAVAVPSEEWGEAVGAAVVLKRGTAVSAAELQQWVRTRLRSSRVPERILFKEQLPYNEMGKVLRRTVREELQTGSGRQPQPP